jgi:putative hemolysin
MWDGINILYIVFFFICLGFSAFFCSAEIAFIGIQKLRLQHLIQSGHPSAKRVAKIMEQPEKFLATVLLGINFFETAVATLGTILAVSLWGKNLGVAIATILITAITLIFAEFVPKSLAARYGEKLALRYAKLIEITSTALYPLVYLLNHIGIRFTKLVGEEVKHKLTISEEEFRTAISVGEKEGVVEEAEAKMLHKVFEFGDRQVREVMTPRPGITWVEKGTKLREFLSIYAQSPHSRFPVYEETVDNIAGILWIEDILLAQAEGSMDKESSVTELARPTQFVPESKPIGELFAEMQAARSQTAIIVDEHGGIAGLITLQQLAEEIVGNLGDGLTRGEKKFETIDTNTFQIDGGMRLEQANEELNLGLPVGDYETVAGFVLSIIGHIPKEGEQLKYDGLTLTITKMKGVKIEKLLVTKG